MLRMRIHLACWVACLGIGSALSPRGARAGDLRITIVSAQIDARKLKGSGDRSAMPFSDLACLSFPGLRHLSETCGIRLAADGVTRLPNAPLPEKAPVDPMVRLELGDRVVRTYPIPSTLSPKWGYSVVVDEHIFDEDDSAAFLLYDYEGPGQEKQLGQGLVKFKELRKPGKRTVKVGPSVLTYEVEKCGAEKPRTYRYSVPANQQIADLARTARTTDSPGGDYVAVPVNEGEVVEVHASGRVQPNAKKYPDRTAGPNGVATISAKVQYNQPGFRDGHNHAALIGQLGMHAMVIGEHKKFTAETAGFLILAINDLKTADNGGAFQVEVVVTTPKSVDERKMKKKGGSEDAGPAGLDPRVIQQVVDSHGAELDQCVMSAANPNGEIVLQFTISGDGTPLVAVEKASPNLKQAGDCMKKKASAWKFPPPRGLVTARYPLSFSAG